MYVHLFRSGKHTSHFELVKFGLQFLKGASVVLWESAFTLRGECGTNVDNSFNGTASAVIFRDSGVENIIKLQIQCSELVANVLV